MELGPEVKSVVYVLIDPSDGKFQYVGQTVNFDRRMKQHLHPSSIRKNLMYNNPPLGRWILSLPKRSGALPFDCAVLETFDTRDGAGKAEDGWIQKLRSEGIDLLNIATGGVSPKLGRKHSAETRAKITAALLHLGPVPAEMRQHQSEAAKRRWANPEERAQRSATAKRRYQDPDQRKKQSQAQKRRFENPQQRQDQIEASTRRWKNPDERKKISTASKRLWQDPEYRAKTLEGRRRKRDKDP